MKNESKGWRGILLTAFLTVLAVFFLIPVFLVLMNSLKGQFYISDAPFALPNSETFVGFRNYWNGIEKVDFFSAFGYSAFITLFSVAAIVLFTAMTAWYLVRAGTRAANGLYYLLVFSMIVPFQMVMFTMSKMANLLHLDNPVGIILLYLGFGSGLSVFLYSGFIKSIPLDVEEAAMIDGCRPWQPYLVIGSRYRTIPIAVQYLQGGYGSRDMGALMATLVLAIIPIIIFYLACQKYIIRGVMAGAVKG